ncbi:MAG: hypothetical protein HY368_00295 [Candidatus Aenigmarchaeota archaeon]|nr:hypothetical protein [Candidatus Aenigmarchaeota archaeon]
MKITRVRAPLGPEHERIREADVTLPQGYKAWRHFEDIWKGSEFYFDIESYVNALHWRKKRPLELLDSGCGSGKVLGQLKQGVRAFTLYRSVSLGVYPGYYQDVPFKVPESMGLKERARITGVTLHEEHSESAENNGLDELIIGPAERHAFDRQFDVILDYAGPAFYFPSRAIPLYRGIIQPDGILIVWLMWDWEKGLITGDFSRETFNREELLERNRFRILAKDEYNFIATPSKESMDRALFQECLYPLKIR